jgi:hypothetical protein
MALVVGLSIGLLLGCAMSLILHESFIDRFFHYAIAYGTMAAAIALVRGGGLACLQHLLLRLLCWMSGYMPWNYARFLNYAAQRALLHRVGGSYLFIHPLLRRYFATLDLPDA